MRVLILGGSGRTGQLIIEEALQRGHRVTALVRNPDKISTSPEVQLVKGTPTDQGSIERAFQATPQDPIEAVIVALNASRASDSLFAKVIASPTFLEDCVRNAAAVMHKHSIRKLVILSAFGIGESAKNLSFLIKLVFRYTNMRAQMDDHERVDATVRTLPDLDFTLVKPGMLKEGGKVPVREFGEDGKGGNAMTGITRASVASFMVDVLEQSQWSQKSAVITN